nr:hypothetical protein CFP56_42592 [Quercus suber]
MIETFHFLQNVLTKERRRRGRRFTDGLPRRGQSREEMSVSELQGNLVICGRANGYITERAFSFLFMDLLSSIFLARSQSIFCLGPKRSFFQKVAFWAEPNAKSSSAFVKCA